MDLDIDRLTIEQVSLTPKAVSPNIIRKKGMTK